MARDWTEPELLIAMNLYCRLPFGKCNSRNKLVNEVARRMDRTAGSVSRKLGNIASLDPRHQARGVGGLPNNSKLDRMIWTQFQQNWSVMAERSEEAFEILMRGTPLAFPTEQAKEIDLPEGPSETNRTVKIRRLQTFFRNTVLASYENRCALTGMAIPQLLVASHIIPWSENEERRADPTNGLCLNVLHDKAFDRHIITFDEDLRLVVSGSLIKGDIPDFQNSSFVEYAGKRLSVPHRFCPDTTALESHRNVFCKLNN
jgi:predicted restriction endonuclease